MLPLASRQAIGGGLSGSYALPWDLLDHSMRVIREQRKNTDPMPNACVEHIDEPGAIKLKCDDTIGPNDQERTLATMSRF